MAKNTARPAWEAWQRAEAQARTIELELHRAWRSFFLLNGPPPPSSLQRSAAMLRAVARVRLENVRSPG